MFAFKYTLLTLIGNTYADSSLRYYLKDEFKDIDLENPVDDYLARYGDQETLPSYGFPLPKGDAFKSIDMIAAEHGYFVEHHEVLTEDGYYLNISRIKWNFFSLQFLAYK